MKVLLGVGGSPDSLAALSRIVDRAAAVGDELTVAILENPATDASRADIAARVKRELDRADVDATVRTVSGDPGSRLVEIAEDEGFDVVALGGGERTPMGKISVGSIAEFVVLNSRVSVFLVR
jgi:nucleotide-binding universal stress UspA family protein